MNQFAILIHLRIVFDIIKWGAINLLIQNKHLYRGNPIFEIKKILIHEL